MNDDALQSLAVYVPMDRRHAMAAGNVLPDRQRGAALFADISGFTQLTEALVRELGAQRGAETLTIYLNLVYDAVIDEVHRFGGSVVAFAGDAITCWFDGAQGAQGGHDASLAAAGAALAMQETMHRFGALKTPAGSTVALSIKAAVATGTVRRFAVGDPDIRLLDALAGETLDRLARAEHHAAKGEVIVDELTARLLNGCAELGAERSDDSGGEQYRLLHALTVPPPEWPWPPLAAAVLNRKQLRPWLLKPVYERLRLGRGDFLAELRPTVALFVRFGGIDYDADAGAGAKLDAYLCWVQGVVARYDGTLIDVNFGDKGSYLYVNFGAPTAHEDNAERAAAAALALHKRPAALAFVGDVQIGISQGRMRAGAYGGASHRTYGVLGDEVNMAARLMMAAGAGRTLVSESVQARLAQRFQFEQLPPLRVKGKSELALVYNLVGERTQSDHSLAIYAAGLPLIGRDQELTLAAECLELTAQGQGQVLSLSGKAGLGKTRLAAEIMRLGEAGDFAVLRGECPSYGANSSYLVWQPIWSDLFELDTKRPVPELVAVIEGKLAAIDPGLLPRLPLLGPLLQLEIEDNDLTRSLDAKLRKNALESLLVDCLAGFAEGKPLLILLDDCQWIDPLSRDLLHALAQAAANLPVMLLHIQRPAELAALNEFSLYDLPYARQVVLEPLAAADARQFIVAKVQQLLGDGREVADALVQRISARAEGNPFLLEELLVYLHNLGADLHNAAAIAEIALPDSLQRLVLSLLDQLPESQKITVKVASVLGRIFRAGWLWGVYPQLGAPARVHKDLELLCRQELLQPDLGEDELTYVFRQMITQNVTYETLPLALKATLHEQIALYIENNYTGDDDRYLDLLAYHYDQTENEEKRRYYLRRAGEAAQDIYANEAALDYYRRVLPLLEGSARTPVLMRLGQVLELVGQWDEAAACYAEALTVAQSTENLAGQTQAQIAIGEIQRKRGHFGVAAGWFDQAYSAAQATGDQPGMAKALICGGTLAAQQGDYAAAATLYEQRLAIRRSLGDQPNTANVLNNLAILAQFQGDYGLSRVYHEEALAIRRGLGGQWAIAMSLNNLGTTLLDQGDYATARAYLEEALALQRAMGDKWAVANALNNLANAQRELGSYALARDLYAESVALNAALSDQRALAYLLEDIGALYVLIDRPVQALMLAGAAATIRNAIESPLSPAEQAALDLRLEAAHTSLGAAGAATALRKGGELSLAQAVEIVLTAE